MKFCATVLLTSLLFSSLAITAHHGESKGTIAVIGTGDMGDSLGPRLAEQGYTVVYGTRSPDSDRAKALVEHTGHGATAATQKDAAAAGDIVILAVGWPAMETVAQNLGSLDGKIVVDISMPVDTGEDGYLISVVETSSAEMIQQWNPGARVVKSWATLGSYVIDNPDVVDGPVTVPIASDDREAKETIAKIIADMGLDPVDAGPLRLARELEALQRLYMVPLIQRRPDAWEPYFRRSYFWECSWEDDWSAPVEDADDLADLPKTQGPPKNCPGTQ